MHSIRSIRSLSSPFVVIAVTVFALVLTSGATEARDPGATVGISRAGFDPEVVTVYERDHVEWVNNDSVVHYVVQIGDGRFASKEIEPADTFEESFNKAGEYAYRCTIHANLTGTVVVLDEDEPLPPGSAATSPGTGGGRTAGAGSWDVPVGDKWFGSGGYGNGSPFVLSIRTGDSVSWSWGGSVGSHNVRGTDASFGSNTPSGPIATGGPILSGPASYGPLVFDFPGSYFFRCSLHPDEMRGQITVSGEATPGSVPPSSSPLPSVAVPEPPAATANTEFVSVVDNSFTPSSLKVSTGTTVRWSWEGGSPHTVTANSFDSGIQEQGAFFEWTFDGEGMFEYRCILHTGMTGNVVAGAAVALAPGAGGTAGPESGTETGPAAGQTDPPLARPGESDPVDTADEVPAGDSVALVTEQTGDGPSTRLPARSGNAGTTAVPPAQPSLNSGLQIISTEIGTAASEGIDNGLGFDESGFLPRATFDAGGASGDRGLGSGSVDSRPAAGAQDEVSRPGSSSAIDSDPESEADVDSIPQAPNGGSSFPANAIVVAILGAIALVTVAVTVGLSISDRHRPF